MKIMPKECLLNNRLNDDLQSFLKPLELTQLTMMQMKYTIRDNYITPNSYSYNIISFIIRILFLMSVNYGYAYQVMLKTNNLNIWTTGVPAFLVGEIILNFNLICLCILNVKHSQLNVQLIVHIQESKNAIKYLKSDIKDLIICNWIYILIAYFMSSIIGIGWFIFKMNIYMIMHAYCWVFFDVSAIYAVCIIKLLKRCLIDWLKEMKYRTEMSVEDFLETEDLEYIRSHWKELQDGFENLSKAYKIYGKVFSMVVSIIGTIVGNKNYVGTSNIHTFTNIHVINKINVSNQI